MIRKSCCIIFASVWLSLGVNWFVLDLLPGATHDDHPQRQGIRELILLGEPNLS